MLEKAWMQKHARNVPVAGLMVVGQGIVVNRSAAFILTLVTSFPASESKTHDARVTSFHTGCPMTPAWSGLDSGQRTYQIPYTAVHFVH